MPHPENSIVPGQSHPEDIGSVQANQPEEVRSTPTSHSPPFQDSIPLDRVQTPTSRGEDPNITGRRIIDRERGLHRPYQRKKR